MIFSTLRQQYATVDTSAPSRAHVSLHGLSRDLCNDILLRRHAAFNSSSPVHLLPRRDTCQPAGGNFLMRLRALN
jgi:hypothetical protein